MVKADNLLIHLNDDAGLVVAESNGPKFDEAGRYLVADSATWAQPAISGTRLFVKDVDSLALWTVSNWSDPDSLHDALGSFSWSWRTSHRDTPPPC